MTRTTAILCVRNEGARLLEWVAHHRAIGITSILAFSNDCEDGTDRMLDRMQHMGWLTHVRNADHAAKGPQWAALKLADRHPLVREADWLLCIDIDEFVNIHAGDGTLSALHAALPGVSAITLTWRLFGNAGIIPVSGDVTRTFTRAAPSVLHWPWRAMLFKTLYRNDGTYGALGVHRPRRPDPDRVATAGWVDGSGRALGDAHRRTRIFSDLGQDNHGLVQLNHYALGSMHDYLLKCDRGRANREAPSFDMGYWIDRNFCSTEDRSILRMEAQGAPLRAEMMANSALAAMHRAAVSWREARVKQLLREEPWRALLGRLMMAPPTRVLDARTARTIWEHGRIGAAPG